MGPKSDPKVTTASEGLGDPSPQWHLWVAASLPIMLLLPFLNKAFHIDDTVYLYVAQHIQNHPIDFFGFDMNWGKSTSPLHVFNKNPPALSYYLALFGSVFGWSEITMHCAQLILTVIAAIGIFRLAERTCSSPLLAVFIAVLTPSFLVSSSVVMCEPLMLTCYVWAMVYWLKASESDRPQNYVFSAVLIGIGILSKFIVVTAIPLLIAYTVFRERRVSRTLFYFLIPVAMLLLFELTRNAQYGGKFLGGIAGLNNNPESTTFMTRFGRNLFEGLSFTGACSITVLFMAPLLHRKGFLAGLMGLYLCIFIAIINIDWLAEYAWAGDHEKIQWGFVLQLSLAATAGVYMLILPCMDLYRNRDEISLLLGLLVIGIFIFSAFLNWTVNARSLFPMLPALAILVVRRFTIANETPRPLYITSLPLVLGALVSMAVCYGDYAYANTTREFVQRYKTDPHVNFDRNWFIGHWGFQYYMEQQGSRPLEWDLRNSPDNRSIEPGDTIVWWKAQYQQLPEEIQMREAGIAYIPGSSWVSTMNYDGGAGFYDSNAGPIPYYFGQGTTEEFWVFTYNEEQDN